MVALAVEELGQIRPLCLSRPLLFKAQDSLEAGNLIEAGCQLREALKLYLVAECSYHRCLPKVRGKKSSGQSDPLKGAHSGDLLHSKKKGVSVSPLNAKLDKLPPKIFARALRKKLGAENICYEWICEIIDTCNSAAHCQAVDARSLRGCISIVHSLLDNSPEIDEPNNLRGDLEGGVV